MRKSTGNMYSFIDTTYNPVKGKCAHNCSYCYMKRFPQKEIHLDEKELNQDLGTGKKIFVCSGTDLFSPEVPVEWVRKVIDKVNQHKNEYFFQSKNPMRMLYYIDHIPRDSIFCTTIESNYNYPEIFCKAPIIMMRYAGIKTIKEKSRRVMVTIEPIMQFDLLELSSMLISLNPEQVNIGADSKRHNLPEPEAWKIEKLIYNLEYKKIKIYRKDNLKRLLKLIVDRQKEI